MKKVSFNNLKIRDPETGKFVPLMAIRGESAYDIAVRLGTFTGTEEEWNNALESERQAAINSIKEQGEITKASIPEDYTALSGEIKKAKSDLSEFEGEISVTIKSNNILNIDEYTDGYISNDGNGNPVSSSTLKYSAPIPVIEGDVIRSYRYDSSTGTLTPYVMEFITAYQNGATLPYHGATKSHTYTVPSEIVDSIVISINPTVVHEITKNYEATEYEEYFPSKTEIKQDVLPVASETAFGVCKIWTTVNEAGENVLNIVTE